MKATTYPSRQKVNTTCPRCGLTVERLARYADRLCRSCAAKEQRKGERRVCAECGDEFYAKAAELKRDGGKYCSRACWRLNARLSDEQYQANAQRMRETRKGKGNPRFKHGKRVGLNIRGWSVRDKDEEFCRLCGALASDLHHAVPRSLSPAGRRDLRNGLPLCRHCHISWHRRGTTIHRDIFTVEEWHFIETLIGPVWLDERYPDRGEGFRKVVGMAA